jgi:hypothetical protein
MATDTITNINGTGMGIDTSSINPADIGSNADTTGRASGTAGGGTTRHQ